MRAVGICFVLAVAALQSVGSARVIVGGWGYGDIDLDGDGRPDLTTASYQYPGISSISSNAYVSAATGSDLVFTPTALTPGSIVDGSTPFGGNFIGESAHASKDPFTGVVIVDNPGGGVEGDYGFRFTSQGATHYGWADVHVQAGIPPAVTVAVVLQSAYESDPNTPITVAVIPEPASAAVLLVAGAALCLRHRR